MSLNFVNWHIAQANHIGINPFRYAYDVIHSPPGSDHATFPPALTNRRLFAFTDCGAPDGIKCDTQGNVYAGCFDGVHVSTSYYALVLTAY